MFNRVKGRIESKVVSWAESLCGGIITLEMRQSYFVTVYLLTVSAATCVVTAWTIQRPPASTKPSILELSLQKHQPNRAPKNIDHRRSIIDSFPITKTWCTPSVEIADASIETDTAIDSTNIQPDSFRQYIHWVNPNMATTQLYELMPVPDRGKLSTHAIHGTLYKECCIERYDVYRRKHTSTSSGDTEESANSANNATTGTTELIVATTTNGTATTARSPPDVIAIVTIGSNLDGHNSIVHGGILALMVDDTLGFGYYSILLQEYEAARDQLKNFGTNDDVGIVEVKLDPTIVAVTANLNMNYRAPLRSNSTVIIEASLVSDSNPKEGRVDKNKFHWDVVVRSLDGSITFCHATSLYVIPKRRLVNGI